MKNDIADADDEDIDISAGGLLTIMILTLPLRAL
jgi:hypothetical protein